MDVTKTLELLKFVKEQYGSKCAVLFRRDERYELYGEDVWRLFTINTDYYAFDNVTYTEGNQTKTTSCASFHNSRLDSILPKFVRDGYRVCICDAPETKGEKSFVTI